MFRMLLALVLIAVLAIPAAAQMPQSPNKVMVDAAYGVVHVQERVVQLPQDQDKPYLTVVGDPADQQVKTVLNWFNTDGNLIAIKNQTHFRFMPTTGNTEAAKFFRQRYSKSVPNTPSILLQRPDGTKIAELGPNEIPVTPEALFNAINRPASECFRRRQDQVQPAPGPAPSPDGDSAPQPLDRRAPPVKPVSYFPWLLLIFVTLCGAGVGVVQKYNEIAKH